MIDSYSSEPWKNNQSLKDIFLLTAWSAVLFWCALTIKNYHLAGQPPLWDNLSYQQQTLHILTGWLDGDWGQAWYELSSKMYPAYLISLGWSFLIFGFNNFSPYIISAVFGTGCLVTVYFLSLELGTRRTTAFWGVITLSLLPSFIYQNFFQTRNDFALAFFIALSWIFLLQGIKLKNIKLAFCAGVIAGIGTLFKASAPGYVAWGILAFLIMPENYIQSNLKDRMKLSLLFLGGAVFSCGWYFLPRLADILSYYTIWGNAQTWVSSQYNLQASWTNHFFYLKNIIFFHLGKEISIGIIIGLGILLIRWFALKRSTNYTEKKSNELPFIFLVLLAGILPIIFISLRQSFSSLGDVPVLLLIAAGSLAFVSKISYGIAIPRVFLICLLPVCLILSISNLPIIEKQFSSNKDIKKFSYGALEIRKEFGLQNTAMMQVFSHPVYNVDTLAWLWLINTKMNRNLIHHPLKKHQVMFPEDSETIAKKLNRFPLLILSEFPGTAIQGEKFNTLNRLHSKINSAIYTQGQFLKIRSLDLDGGRFPVHFMLNKNFSVLRSVDNTTDHWTKWGGEVQYFSSKQAKLIWRSMPIRKMDSFKLVYKDNQALSIKMSLHQILPNGKYEYKSESVPATGKLLTLIIMPESSKLLLPASKIDNRMLAFNKVETEVVKYD